MKRYGLSFLAPKAQRKVGMLLEKHGDYDKAYDAYNYYLTKYPQGEDFDSVVESMFKIAKMFLDGRERKLFGVPVAASMGRAQVIKGIVKNAPYSKYAPLAQFNVGTALEKQGDFPKAIEAYQLCVNKYPGDAIADDALYQVGYVRLRESREGSYDRATSAKARESFEDFGFATTRTAKRSRRPRRTLNPSKAARTKARSTWPSFTTARRNSKPRSFTTTT